ncbi:ABC transporter permease [Pelosinus propionicus]|uniref:NitT/TauT family transport system permease protein n=1 Tax=Pelosinus propionicus DSM 13327 TaxID=1123291 RepID=A0A1I4LPV9_9FIRM|nr:ABC transporter permease [Pelosinus propionicus]SFL93044.1 NitT/TauT family transport system permease protein [Pelosinus propionicus DSM 13327]
MKKLANFFTGSLEKTIGLILFVGLWELAPQTGWVNSTYLSPPSTVVSALIVLLKSRALLKHLLISLQRALVGMAVAVSFGMVFGLFIGYFKKIEGYLDALFQSFRQMSAFALFPVFILLFGVGELSKTIIIFWASLWPILLNTINGVKNVDTLLIQSAKSMGASQKFIFLRVILPAAAPDIFTGIRLGASYCVMSLVAAEMIGATSGLGYLILYSQETFNIPDMYAGIVGLAIMGLGINYALKLIEKSFSSWKQGVAVGE